MQNTKIRILIIILLLYFPASLFSQTKTAAVSKETTVYVFLSETCPICQSYTLTLKDLYKKYHDQHIRFVGVFPNYYTTQQSIDEFKKKYAVPFELIPDKNATLTKHFNATTTPEVFVESASNQVLYSGRIDDSFYTLGKRRTVVTSAELADALSAITRSQPVKTSKTQAVGCVISSSK